MVDGEVLTLHCEGLDVLPSASTSWYKKYSMPEQKGPNCAGAESIGLAQNYRHFAGCGGVRFGGVLRVPKRASRLECFAQLPIAKQAKMYGRVLVSALRRSEGNLRAFFSIHFVRRMRRPRLA